MLINVFCLPLLCGDTAVCGVVCVTDSIKEVVECDCSVASRHVVSCRVVSCVLTDYRQHYQGGDEESVTWIILCRAVPWCVDRESSKLPRRWWRECDLCYVELCCAVLCCAVLCCAVLCCAVLCCAVLCCAVLCCAVLCWQSIINQHYQGCDAESVTCVVLCRVMSCCVGSCHVVLTGIHTCYVSEMQKQ